MVNFRKKAPNGGIQYGNYFAGGSVDGDESSGRVVHNLHAELLPLFVLLIFVFVEFVLVQGSFKFRCNTWDQKENLTF